MAALALTDAVTFGEIVEALDERDHRVRYAMRRAQLQPVRRCGNAYVWAPSAIEVLREELHAIDARRCARREPP